MYQGAKGQRDNSFVLSLLHFARRGSECDRSAQVEPNPRL